MRDLFSANLSLQSLAELFAASFGPENWTNSALPAKTAISELHRENFFYAMPEDDCKMLAGSSDPPPDLDFLEILIEFVKKFPEEGRRSVFNDIQAECRKKGLHMPLMDILSSRVDEWQSLGLYCNSLGEVTNRPQPTAD